MKSYAFTIRLQHALEGGYTVTVPALPGCVTEGDTYEEALEMAHDAISLYVQSLIDDGLPIPTEPEALEAHLVVRLPIAASSK